MPSWFAGQLACLFLVTTTWDDQAIPSLLKSSKVPQGLIQASDLTSDSTPYIHLVRNTETKSVVVIVNNVSCIQGLSLGLHFPAASEARVPRLGRRTGACFPGFSPSGVK